MLFQIDIKLKLLILNNFITFESNVISDRYKTLKDNEPFYQVRLRVMLFQIDIKPIF